MNDRKKTNYAQFDKFPKAIAEGMPNDWRCRAGSRYLSVCEDGLVHYCSQQRGYPGVPVAEYTREDVKREFLTAEELRTELHGGTCAPDQLHRPLESAADVDGESGGERGTGAVPPATDEGPRGPRDQGTRRNVKQGKSGNGVKDWMAGQGKWTTKGANGDAIYEAVDGYIGWGGGGGAGVWGGVVDCACGQACAGGEWGGKEQRQGQRKSWGKRSALTIRLRGRCFRLR